MQFKEWMNGQFVIEEKFGTRAKFGLYANVGNAVFQYPPLYASPRAADFITYFWIRFGKSGLESKDGYVYYDDKDVGK
jgi:hypothetical protein